MSNLTVILGDSGTGKSTSLRNLNPKETFILNVLDKPLPFRGYKNNYLTWNKDNPNGNYCATDDYEIILRAIKYISSKRLDIKNLIIDDFHFVMANEFMRRSSERGYERFTDIGSHTFKIVEELKQLRDDLYCFILSHTETDPNGKIKCKTIGKVVDDKVGIDCRVTTIFHTRIIDAEFKFLTQNDGIHLAKSPMGMFEDRLIDNDLNEIKKIMIDYYKDENNG